MAFKALMERLQEFAHTAVQVERERDYPPELLIAQWAVESGWGIIESGRNNCFGMTRAKRHGDNWAWISTTEVLSQAGIDALPVAERARVRSKKLRPDGKFDVCLSRQFACYDTFLDGVMDKVELIQNGAPYKAMFAAYRVDRDLNKLIDAVAKVYATDPGYATLVKRISVQPNVRDAIAAARKSKGTLVS